LVALEFVAVTVVGAADSAADGGSNKRVEPIAAS